jgi:hypothetical protein
MMTSVNWFTHSIVLAAGFLRAHLGIRKKVSQSGTELQVRGRLIAGAHYCLQMEKAAKTGCE